MTGDLQPPPSRRRSRPARPGLARVRPANSTTTFSSSSTAVLLRAEAAVTATMLPSSVRRVVAAAPPSGVVCSLASAVPRAAAAYSLPYKATGLHQRRYSSSKPSSPDDGSRDFAARSVPASRAKSEKTKGQAKSVAPQPPSVPSTRHIGGEGWFFFFCARSTPPLAHTVAQVSPSPPSSRSTGPSRSTEPSSCPRR